MPNFFHFGGGHFAESLDISVCLVRLSGGVRLRFPVPAAMGWKGHRLLFSASEKPDNGAFILMVKTECPS